MGAFCRHGHPLIETNLYRDPKGYLSCRTCRAIHQARWCARNPVKLREKERRRRPRIGAERETYMRWYYLTHGGANRKTTPLLLHTVLAETGREAIDPIGLEMRG